MNSSIFISFTTTPDRIAHIKPMIESLLRQKALGQKIILWVCRKYERSGHSFSVDQVPSFIKSSPVEVCFSEDYGSNTKLYPTLKLSQNPEDFILTVDDDTIYPEHWLENLILASKKDPKNAYGYRGKVFERRFFQIPFIKTSMKRNLNYDYSKTIMLNDSSQTQEVDLLTGVWGICYRRSFFDSNYFLLETCPSAKHNDDIWANGHLAKKNIKRICIGTEETFADIHMEKAGVKRLWDSVNNGKGLNNKTLTFFKHDW